ncbi:MAG: hypothetical protein ACLSCR_06245 [Akkermansia sp.]
MSFNQRRQGRLFRVSWGACLLLSVLAHLFLLAGTYLVPEEWLSSPRPAEARRQVVVTARMVRKVEPEKEGNRQAPQERLPSVVKTSEEQESATRPETPRFQSNRNTRREGGRKDPDSSRDMPAQDGEERENGELVLFDQERQDGDMSHERDGNKDADPGLPPACPSSRWTRPPSAGPSGRTESFPNATGSLRRRGRRPCPAGQDACAGTCHAASPCGHAAPARQAGRTGRPEGTGKSIARGADRSPLDLPDLQLPPNARPPQKQPLYDPMFNAENQPGFKTHERKTKLTGKFSFGRRPTLDVEATPLGRYQMIVYRAIGEQWYRQCDLNRDLIVAGTVRIRILIAKNGNVTSMRQTSRVGASEVQKSFTFLAIKLAKLPAMPPEVRNELVGETLEMYFDFNF